MNLFSRRHLIAGVGGAVASASVLARSGGLAALDSAPDFPETVPGTGGIVLALTPTAFVQDGSSTVWRANPAIPVGSTIVAADLILDANSLPVVATISPAHVDSGAEPLYKGSLQALNLTHSAVAFQMQGPFEVPEGAAVQIIVDLKENAKLYGARVRYLPPSSVSTSSFVAGPIGRVVDTRIGLGGPRLEPSEERTIGLAGVGQTAVFNVTVTESPGAGWLSVFPAGMGWPGTSSINWAAGATVASLVITGLGPNRQIVVRCGPNPTHFLIDFVGTFA